MVIFRGMRPQGTPRQLEKRRRQAIQLLNKGKTVSAIARWIGASKSSVVRWRDAYHLNGLKALRPRPTPGRPSRLTSRQKEGLTRALVEGPLAAGYTTDLWTLKRVAQVIWKRFRIRYHPNHLWRLLGQLGWSCQKPERRAKQRDEKAIMRWKQSNWPRIKKNRTTWRPSRIHG